MIYQLIGIRNKEHAETLFRQIEKLPHHEEIHLHKDELQIELNNMNQCANLQRLLAYEKVGLKEIAADTSEHHHDHNQAHDHHHGHSHSHEVDFSKNDTAAKNMLIVFWINIFFSIAEAIFGFLFNSASILSDAVHDFGDALSIGLAWIFQKLSTKGSDKNFSYGYKRYSLLGALITSIVLIIGSGIMLVHAGEKLVNPEPVNHQGMFYLAIFALIANGYSAWLISKGSSHNESILSLHLLEDVLGWVGVLIVSIILQFTDWYFLDPLLSIGIALFILWKTLPEFLRVVRIFLQAVPDKIDSKALKNEINAVAGVENLSHYHIWTLDGESHMMSVTVSTHSDVITTHEQIKNDIRHILAHYDIVHSNIEIVYDPLKLFSKNK